ncbi:MAG: DUF1579 domain-containing protein [Planctomycetes bacterium]|nr:DUF1579 domain-containing protein [Planctomycetota bacterium]
MRWKRPLTAAAVLAATCVTFGAGYAVSSLQDPGKKAPQGEDLMEAPKPGPEHAVLAKQAGSWDAEIVMAGSPEMPGGMKSKGSETCRLLQGGLWLLSDFQGEMMGMPFHGHGISGYDPEKKKTVGAWVDSMGTHLGTFEGDADPTGKKQTSMMMAPGMTGEMVKHTMVHTWIDDDTRTFKMSLPGPDGKDFEAMTITYKRRK